MVARLNQTLLDGLVGDIQNGIELLIAGSGGLRRRAENHILLLG